MPKVSEKNSPTSEESPFDYWSHGVAEDCGCAASPLDNSCRPEPRYNGWGIFALLWGMSAKPHSVVFKCWTCNRTVFESKDETLLTRHGKT